jgi:hypothetical protein
MAVKRFLLLALVFSVMVTTGPVLADGEFYVIAGGGGVGTRITSVPYTISSPGFYYLSQNLTYNGAGNAIYISADDVTLDLMGFRLTNSGAQGSTCGIYYMSGRTNVEVRNGTVSGFSSGFLDNGVAANKHRVINVRVTNNTNGIWFYGNNHLIKNCSASNNTGTGLFINSGLITDSVASNNVIGISLSGPGSILGNTACNNTNLNFTLGSGIATSILVDRNSAFGLATNYGHSGSGIVITTNNSGTP